MEGLISFAGIIMIVFGILQIVLFFKLWGMTDDIKAIKNKYLEFSSNSSDLEPSSNKSSIPGTTNKNSENTESKLEVGALVMNIKSGKQMRIKEINPITGKYNCFSSGGMFSEGNFDESEIKLL
jgi:hypothetical protein